MAEQGLLNKNGWEMNRKACFLLLAGLVLGPSGAALGAVRGETLYAGPQWAALRFAGQCEALARPLPPSSAREPQARAGFTFSPRGQGRFQLRLSRAPRAGSSVLLTVGDRPFLLAARGAWAWSRHPEQDQAIIAAVRASRSMRVHGRDSGGRRFTDRYLLDGAPTAIDAAAAGCAGKI